VPVPRLLLVAVMAGFITLTAGCGSGSTATPNPTRPAGSTGTALAAGELTVLAAASLTDVFATITAEFEAANPGVTVKTSFAASSALATQIREGAPADVFASADETTMTALFDENLLAGPPTVFARNGIAIAVAPGNPKGITGLADLAEPGVVYVAAGPRVPITRYATQAARQAGVALAPVSEEGDVRAVLTKVSSGEADAGIVYTTDVAASKGGVTGIELTAVGIVASYPAATLAEAGRADLADAFVAHLTSPTAERMLADAGFSPPS